MRNILIKIAYDGTNFSGWQRQPESRTVCGCVEAALTRLIGSPVKIDGTSRTDAGVHALGQCASFQLPDGGIPTERIPKALNNILADDRLEGISNVRILEAKEMPEGFHARFSSRGKRYIYRIVSSAEKSVFRRTRFYQTGPDLDTDAMRAAAKIIEGTHDFAAFQSSGSTPRESTVRTVYSLRVIERELADDIESIDAKIKAERRDQEISGSMPESSAAAESELCAELFQSCRAGGDLAPECGVVPAKEIILVVEGDGFLYNMVRIIAGTLVEAGQHRRSLEDIEAAVRTGKRSLAGHVAPPQGLCLDEVFF